MTRLVTVVTKPDDTTYRLSERTATWRKPALHLDGLRATAAHELKWHPGAKRVTIYLAEGDPWDGEEEKLTELVHVDRPPAFDEGDRVRFKLPRALGFNEATVSSVIGDLGESLIVRYDNGDARAVSAYECSILGAREISGGPHATA